MKRLLIPMLISALFVATQALAGLPGEQLADPRLEARARALSQELRCVVCQNQTIDDSDASIAHDLRLIVRERLRAGDSDEQAKAFIVSRYGSYVLLKPPLEAATILLWFGPLLILVAGAIGTAFYLRNRGMAEHLGNAMMTKEEEIKLAGILREEQS
jgi:cytochrome c-type biogenesis protein CcmH